MMKFRAFEVMKFWGFFCAAIFFVPNLGANSLILDENSTQIAQIYKIEISNSAKICEISLRSNPTTGYSWEISIENDDKIALISQEFKQDKAPKNFVGVGGKEIFRFKGILKGEASVKFRYQRPWEKSAADEIEIKFEIDEKLNPQVKEISQKK